MILLQAKTHAAPAIINGEPVNVGVTIQFQSNGRPRAVNVEYQSGEKFVIDTKKVPVGLDSRVERYVQGTSLPTTGTIDSIRNKSEKSNPSDEKNSAVLPSAALETDEAYLAVAEKYRDGTATEAIDKLQQKWENALRIAAKNQTAINGIEGIKNTATEGCGRVQYSLADASIPTYEELVAKKPLKIVNIKEGITSASYADMKSATLEKAKTEEWYEKPHLNDDTDSFIFLTEKSFTHAFSNLTFEFGEDTIRCMAHIPEVIKEAYLVSVDDPKDASKRETKVYVFFGAVDGINGVEPVKLTVKEFDYQSADSLPQNIRAYFEKNGIMDSYTSLYDAKALEVIGIEGIKIEPDASVEGGEKVSLAQDTSDSSITVADLLALVKGDAQKYIPAKARIADDADYLSLAEKYRGGTATEAIDKLQQKWETALRVAAENQIRLNGIEGIKNTATEGGEVQYSSRAEVLQLEGVDWMDDFSSIKDQLEKHSEDINNLDPVCVVTYDGEKSKDKLTEIILNAVNKIGGKNMKNGSVTFEFEKTGTGTMLAHSGDPEIKAAALSAPYVAKYGKMIAGHKNHEGQGTTTLTFAAPAIINGVPVNVGVVILFTKNGRPKAVNVELQSGEKFVLKTKKVSAGNGSRVERYVQGTALPTTDTKDIVPDSLEKSNLSDEQNSAVLPASALDTDEAYLAVAEKYRDGTATEAETEQLTDEDLLWQIRMEDAKDEGARDWIDQAKGRAEKLKDLRAQLADAKRQMQTTNREMNKKGFSPFVKELAETFGIKDRDMQRTVRERVLDLYQKVQEEIDKGHDEVADRMLTKGAEKIGEWLIDHGYTAEKLGRKWTVTDFAQQFA